MSRDEFIENVADMISNAIMRAQGFGDWMPSPELEEIAATIASMVPDYAWSEPDA